MGLPGIVSLFQALVYFGNSWTRLEVYPFGVEAPRYSCNLPWDLDWFNFVRGCVPRGRRVTYSFRWNPVTYEGGCREKGPFDGARVFRSGEGVPNQDTSVSFFNPWSRLVAVRVWLPSPCSRTYPLC